MTQAIQNLDLRASAEQLAAQLPPLRAEAHRLARSVHLGSHGRRRAGVGEDFWQFRHAVAGDSARRIDWRRSARDEGLFVREQEWQSVQSVFLWADPGRSLDYASDPKLATKSFRVQSVALATAILLLQMGERVGLLGDPNPPLTGISHIDQLAHTLVNNTENKDHVELGTHDFPRGAQAVLLSDFLGDLDGIERTVDAIADAGGRGVLVQVLDPVEENFPFDGRTIFESVAGTTKFETRRARSLRDAYQSKLAARRSELEQIARNRGWHFTIHHTNNPATALMLWLYRSIEGHKSG